ncbi:MAG TPA: PIN domain-containing protein [Vicinamibacterales bacterium]|nr:PIN domain-containing protein [Vicinamibacterales bacterium]
MSVLLDTGIVYAYYDRSDRWHRRARALIATEQRGLILPAPVIPEVDHLLGRRLGARSRLTFYEGIVEGYYLVRDLAPSAYARVVDLNRQFADLELGFVDGAIVALAETLGLSRVATTDRRHFDPLGAALSLEILP